MPKEKSDKRQCPTEYDTDGFAIPKSLPKYIKRENARPSTPPPSMHSTEIQRTPIPTKGILSDAAICRRLIVTQRPLNISEKNADTTNVEATRMQTARSAITVTNS